MRRIAVITASRADWGIYQPVIRAIKDCPDLLLNVQAEGETDYLDFPLPCEFLPGDEDCRIVLGDTMPMLRAAIWAAEHNIPICHIHGGDMTGSIDNKIRYAISAFADWHFPSLPAHAERLRQMGYPKERIKVVGPLGIYAMKDADYVPEVNLRRGLGLSDKQIIIVIQHPVSSEVKQARQQMRETMEALSAFPDCEPMVIYPNGELGSDEMIEIIKQYPFKAFKNLSYLLFISLLKYSSVIVGNSSCGLVEAPLFGVPCVNVGTRQGSRQRGSTTYNAWYDKTGIISSLRNALVSPGVSYNPYALDIDGCGIIVKTLESL